MPAAPQVILNDELMPAAAARISPLSDGFLFGHGVFETLKARAGRAVHLADHHARLASSCAALGLAAPDAPDVLGARITRLLAASGLPAAAVKVVRFQDLSGTAELVTARTLPYSPTDYLRGFRLKTFRQDGREGRVTPHKSLNYLENLRARHAARDDGADEALFVTPAGHVLEGAASTIFAVKDGVATTPPLSAGILPGVVRARVLALLAPVERIREDTLTLDALLAADEVFVTNALMGVMPVASIDGRAFPPRAPFVAALRQLYAETEAREG